MEKRISSQLIAPRSSLIRWKFTLLKFSVLGLPIILCGVFINSCQVDISRINKSPHALPTWMRESSEQEPKEEVVKKVEGDVILSAAVAGAAYRAQNNRDREKERQKIREREKKRENERHKEREKSMEREKERRRQRERQRQVEKQRQKQAGKNRQKQAEKQRHKKK
ncbi:unnamed protein product [Ranitomeya imitator]|uniref:Uncharacterized protein n=1 Tax=Ranitomeya imitator TaxID=111125 RepID=A0ABN9LTH9_9NEOB|nr:unnamed protein product [Ranitomeya imitator]